MLASLREVAGRSRDAGTGLGAFNVVHLEHATAFVRAAERADRPVVLQISENAVRYHGALEPICLAALAVARHACVPVVVHLDHAEDTALIRLAVDLGISSVMYDGSKLPDADNREVTKAMAILCHAAGVTIEAELGEVGGKNGVHDPSARTSPEDAAAFVAETGVDLLAVAVGSSHAMTTRDAHLDEDLIRAIRAAIPVPLVLHGSSGVSDDGMRSAITAGMTKINVSTHLSAVFTGSVRAVLGADQGIVDSRKWMAPARAAVEDEAFRLLRLYS
ncbi:MAG TPA: class II fructose-bisphosphate aldolase [Propionicimonas sp.]|jgi:fructose-bisphosphate aldolase class II/tagatose 1,6-diphosphate aldolase GatY/KbaY|uniref:class II fructose-bisphosphate aldolase n=1 Tax=Propionicimonas sp. TaxID=1955623 RepID=UPI002F40EE25